MTPVKSVSNKKDGKAGAQVKSITNKRVTTSRRTPSVATRNPSTSSTSFSPDLGAPKPQEPKRQLKEQAKGLLRKLLLMVEDNVEQTAAVVGLLEAAVKLVESSRPSLHFCLICAYRSDTEALFDAHLAHHQKGMKFCCAFPSCCFASETSQPVVEHVKRKHFTDEFDLRVAHNYVHEM